MKFEIKRRVGIDEFEQLEGSYEGSGPDSVAAAMNNCTSEMGVYLVRPVDGQTEVWTPYRLLADGSVEQLDAV